MREDSEMTLPSPNPLGALLSSANKGDLVMLFHRNPGLIDTIEGIARRLGKKGAAIKTDVSELERASILRKKVVGKSEVYFLNREKDKQAKEDIASYIVGLVESKKQK